MGKASAETLVHAPVEQVFGYVDDYTNTTKFMHGLKRWESVSEETHDVGARFAGSMEAGPKTWDSTVEITERVENERIAWEPVEGFQQSGLWTFSSEGDDTRVRLEVDFSFPGGLAGKAVAKAAEPAVKSNVQKTVEKLKQQVEAQA